MILPDVMAKGMVLMFCGTAVSRISRAKGYPYANPGNAFWPTLKKLKFVPADFDPRDFPRMAEHGIGYTDVNKTEFGQDAELSPHAFDADAVRHKLRRYKPKLLAFTSKNAAMAFYGHRRIAFGRQLEPVEGAEVHVLHSPSGLARSHWDIAPWRELARRFRAIANDQ
jgi:TDG/mug DNA glycosylase family protein